ncbi:MAG: putative CAMK family protein kinase [Streblomastix strix]|uniref:Putative CAMK family protein kinase n=1 Tax=Streblomastix strix TaxID=222440 RepID=A0A5J4VDV2_9EUKA|nr:MAG: putative CAMK family protein kinase [Streblomastix strix]
MDEVQILEGQGFKVFKYLGKGAFGLVYLVYSTQTGLVVAKIIKKSLFNENDQNQEILVQIGEQIQFMVKFIAIKQNEEHVIVIQEFANMQSLSHVIRRKANLSKESIRAIAKQLLEGLKLIHAKGIVHNNIKGENILLHNLQEFGNVIVKIADCALVKTQDIIQMIKMPKKRNFLTVAPERLIEEGIGDEKTDMYSAGVVLFQLVAHDYPVKAIDIQDMISKIQLGTINRPVQILDDKFWDLLVNLLAFDRTKRFSAEQALKHPYFTSIQALNEISQESIKIAASAQLAKSNGDTNITIYDVDPSYRF